MSNNKIIQFPTQKQDIIEDSDENFVVDTTKNSPELMKLLDYIWSEIYVGKQIKDLRADDDGRIYFSTYWAKYRELDVNSLAEHISFIVKFVTDRKLNNEFMRDYDSFIKEVGITPYISRKKENTSP